jgi:folate-dependent phosphoribosylglycinamide formyltransferase PurN
MRTLLICHHDARLDRELMPRWLASFSDYAGSVVIRDARRTVWRRVRREFQRSGAVGLADVLAMRVYYRLRLAGDDARREEALRQKLSAEYPPLARAAPAIEVQSPNSMASLAFVQRAGPDIILARCKHLLKPSVYSQAKTGTFVLHPGICPEYRNAHGCFWALARGEQNNVGTTLLKIDEGVDTGPIFGYFRLPLVDPGESHVSIQTRVVYENLPDIRDMLVRIQGGEAKPLDTSGRASAVWGQPRLTSYWRWKRSAAP